MKPWTAPLLVTALMCLILINTAGYPHCLHISAPVFSNLFGWPNTYLWADFTPSQREQVRVDNYCACRKPIKPIELPWQQPEMAHLNYMALRWNITWAILLLAYLAIVLELLQRRFIRRPFTIRGGLFLTAFLALFITLSRSDHAFPFYVEHIRLWMLIKLLAKLLAPALLVYLTAITLLKREKPKEPSSTRSVEQEAK